MRKILDAILLFLFGMAWGLAVMFMIMNKAPNWACTTEDEVVGYSGMCEHIEATP